jgi:hypothetical protein
MKKGQQKLPTDLENCFSVQLEVRTQVALQGSEAPFVSFWV